MKFLLMTVMSLSVNLAHASYYATHCSNATGSVRWEEGHNSNNIFMKYYGAEELTKTFPKFHVNIVISDEKILSESSVHECGFSSYTKIYAGKVKITATAEHPDALQFLSVDKVETDVICEHHINGRAPCPN
ncbi:MAG TPA: hypothetical protein VNJ01_03295 [Bacteriovoracaceae bacterium]|nr:hypothetical protein [Bacteriovoracaceae bacterium]